MHVCVTRTVYCVQSTEVTRRTYFCVVVVITSGHNVLNIDSASALCTLIRSFCILAFELHVVAYAIMVIVGSLRISHRE